MPEVRRSCGNLIDLKDLSISEAIRLRGGGQSQINQLSTSLLTNKLTEATLRSPFVGIGKPEALRENLAEFWLRRIDDTNRLVYAVDDKHLTVISCRYHYTD